MSRVLYLVREPVVPAKRRRWSGAARAALAAAYEGLCALCRANLPPEWQWDHTLALELGGADSVANAQPLCVPCHKVKTAADAKAIAKVHRLERDADPETRKRSKRPIRSRPFQRREPA